MDFVSFISRSRQSFETSDITEQLQQSAATFRSLTVCVKQSVTRTISQIFENIRGTHILSRAASALDNGVCYLLGLQHLPFKGVQIFSKPQGSSQGNSSSRVKGTSLSDRSLARMEAWQLRKQDQKIAALEEEAKRAQQDIASAKAQIDKDIKVQKDQQTEIDNLSSEVKALHANLESRQEELGHAQNQNKQLSEELLNARNQLDELQVQLRAFQARETVALNLQESLEMQEDQDFGYNLASPSYNAALQADLQDVLKEGYTKLDSNYRYFERQRQAIYADARNVDFRDCAQGINRYGNSTEQNADLFQTVFLDESLSWNY